MAPARRADQTDVTSPTSDRATSQTSLAGTPGGRLDDPPRAPEPPQCGTEWHVREPGSLAAELDTSTSVGLDEAEAARRLSVYGANELEVVPGVTPWRLLFEQFENVLILILLAGAGLSAILGHETEAIVIAVIVVFAALLGFVQEYRAERALEALRELAAPTATVVRAGSERDVPTSEVVPGDLVRLAAGDKVPADGRVCDAINLAVEEAALTGESMPVEKTTAALSASSLPIGDRINMVFAGTTVTHGRGTVLVVATGSRTEFGAIARMLETIKERRTPLQQSLDRVGVVLARVALVVVAVIVGLGLLRDEPFLEMLVFGVAVAVAVVPEALPAVVTISLSLAAQRMARRNALVRRLPAVETLGSVSVIGSDKTGTLTADQMTVRRIWVAGEMFDVSGSGYAREGQFLRDGTPLAVSEPLRELLRAAALASDARLIRGDDGGTAIRGDPTEAALVVAAAKAGIERDELVAAHPRVGEIAFTSERKRMTTLHEAPGGWAAYSKGAPEALLRSCSLWLSPSGEERLDQAGREALLDVAQQLASEALRVLAVARRTDASTESAESEMTFLGLVGMIDPPRPEAKDAIRTCARAGIKPVMITGDHPLTASAIAAELGLLRSGRVMTGADLDAMTATELEHEVESIEVYARVSPAHKLRVVEALQAAGHSVAMTGDGVNDAPALKRADIGVAMGITGTDVTREAADMTLTDDNFASIVAAVEEGRGVFANIKKYLMYLLSANLGEIGLLTITALLGKPLPLSAVQILYVNLATDGLPALALAVDPPERDLMHRPPRRRDVGIFTRPVVGLITLGGLWSAAVTVGLFTSLLASGSGLSEARTSVFATLILIELFKAFSFRSDRRSTFERPFRNRWLNLAVAWEVALLTIVLNVPFLESAFGTTDLSLAHWALVVGAALTIVPVLELGKLLVRRGAAEANLADT
jgi:Ca2+-transporting ATPase